MSGALALRGRAAAAVLSLALVAGLLVTSDPGRLAAALRGRGLGIVVAVVALYLLNTMLKAGRWWVLLRGMGLGHAYPPALRAHAVGMAVNNLLPTGLAGEPVRLARLEGRVSGPGLAATAADRSLDAVMLAIVAVGAVPLLAGIDPSLVGPIVAVSCVSALGVAIVGGAAWRRLGLRDLRRRPGHAAIAAGLTLPIQANDAVRLMLLAGLYGADVGFWRAFGIVALGTMAGMLTIVGAGAGLAATVAALVAASGAPAAGAAAVGLVFVATSTWISFPLGAAAAMGRRRHPTRDKESQWT